MGTRVGSLGALPAADGAGLCFGTGRHWFAGRYPDSVVDLASRSPFPCAGLIGPVHCSFGSAEHSKRMAPQHQRRQWLPCSAGCLPLLLLLAIPGAVSPVAGQSITDYPVRFYVIGDWGRASAR